jgi:hypothetical protein
MSSSDAMRLLIASIVTETIDQLAPHLVGAGDARLSLEDAATLACVTPRSLRDAGRRGQIVLEKAGRAVVVRRSAIEAWLTSRAVTPKTKTTANDARAEARTAVAAAAARAGGSH